MFFLRATEHTVGRLLADGVLDDGGFSGYCFLLAWWRNSRLVGWRSDYEGHWSQEASLSKEFILFINVVYQATWKAMKKEAFIQLLCLPTFLHLRMRPKAHWFWSAMQRRIRLLDAVTIQAGQKFPSNLWRKQIFASVILNDCQDMLQNADEIISWPFPVKRVFNQRLTNIEVGLFYNHFFNYDSIVELKFHLKVVLNST